ncbi:sensor histidine kinase [Lysinibacillus fusiformis]|uniref:sensor histidine kinase n=1 Tax=Lysinibacillus sp. PWR01 TaxID=3342384 RepID=UPI00372D122B
MQDKLFQQYYRRTTTDTSSEGTGVGMAIVYNLVQTHRGTIALESELAKGAAFIVTFPKKWQNHLVHYRGDFL